MTNKYTYIYRNLEVCPIGFDNQFHSPIYRTLAIRLGINSQTGVSIIRNITRRVTLSLTTHFVNAT